MAAAAAMAAVLAGAVPPASAAEGVRSAKLCIACHGSIHKAWSGSVKAAAWTNPVFQAGLELARAALGDSVRVRCLACHAPLAAALDAAAPAPPESGPGAVAREGITCGFCHNVSAVEASPRPASYTLDTAHPNLMRGPYDDSDPKSGHDFAFSEIHTRAEFCAACHWAENERGVPTQATYAQWKSSRAASSGVRCQDCHMPAAAGKASPMSRKTRAAVSAHTFEGPRTVRTAATPGAATPGAATALGGLDSAAALSASIESGRLRLVVAAKRGGHALPGGGYGMRAITLEARFQDGNGREIGRSVVATYGVEYADAQGRSPVPKWLAATVARAREIPADSVVVEWTDVPAGAKRAEAILTYHSIHPSWRPELEAKGVPLEGRDPVVLSRAQAPVP